MPCGRSSRRRTGYENNREWVSQNRTQSRECVLESLISSRTLNLASFASALEAPHGRGVIRVAASSKAPRHFHGTGPPGLAHTAAGDIVRSLARLRLVLENGLRVAHVETLRLRRQIQVHLVLRCGLVAESDAPQAIALRALLWPHSTPVSTRARHLRRPLESAQQCAAPMAVRMCTCMFLARG